MLIQESLVREIVAETLEIDQSKILKESLLSEDLGMDSIDLVELLVKLEDKTGFEIQADELASVSTFQDVLSFLQSFNRAEA